MAALARHAPSRLSARKLAELARVPLPMLTNILHQLLHHGLVESTRGAQGGYRLARQPNEITLFDMIEAVEGPVKLTLCCCDAAALDATHNRCDLEWDCSIKEPVRRVHASLRRFLAQVALSQIAGDNVPVEIGIAGVTRRHDRRAGQPLDIDRSAGSADWHHA